MSDTAQRTNVFTFNFPTVSNHNYSVIWSTLAPSAPWGTLTNVPGNGAPAVIRDPVGQYSAKFYRVFNEAPLRYLTVGHVGPASARIALGLDAPRDLRLIYSTNADLAHATLAGPFVVTPDHDFTRVIDLAGLRSDTHYYFNVLLDWKPYYSEDFPGFRTSVPDGNSGVVKIAFGSCYFGSSAGGYDTVTWQATRAADWIWQSVAEKSPDFFIHLGDTAYCDNLHATDLNSYRLVHRHSLDKRLANMSSYARFRRHFPFYTTWDDHEIQNDWPWNPLASGPWHPAYLPICKQAFREYHGRGNPDPFLPGELYYAFQHGDVGVFMTDTRSFRSCQQGLDSLADLSSGTVTITFNARTGIASGSGWNGGLGFTPALVGRTLRLANGDTRYIVAQQSSTQITISEPWLFGTFTFSVLGKTLLGATQKQHLKDWLLQNKNRLRVKFIGTATPIHGLTEHITRKDSWGAGYQAELNDLLDFINANAIRNVVFLSGDQHWAGSFNRRRGAVNFFDFMSSSLSSSFYPRYTGTNSVLLSRVNWMYDASPTWTRGENFGLVTVRTDTSPLTVTFELFDAFGSLLNSTSLTEGPNGLELAQ